MVKYYELINWYFTYDDNKEKECLCGDYKPSMIKDSKDNYEYNTSGVYRFLSHATIDRKKSKKVSEKKESVYETKIDKSKKKGTC